MCPIWNWKQCIVHSTHAVRCAFIVKLQMSLNQNIVFNHKKCRSNLQLTTGISYLKCFEIINLYLRTFRKFTEGHKHTYIYNALFMPFCQTCINCHGRSTKSNWIYFPRICITLSIYEWSYRNEQWGQSQLNEVSHGFTNFICTLSNFFSKSESK